MSMLKKFWISLKLSANYIKVMPQLVVGAWKIGRLPQPVVSIFGGSRLSPNSPYVRAAEEVSRRLVARGISVLTGGGEGIMAAGNCGAFRKNYDPVHTMGIGVRGVPDENSINPCVKNYVITDYFAIRKILLINYSYAYIIFPGGFGTMDELADVLTQMQTNKIPVAPVVLYGEEYWASFMSWVQRANKEGLIPQEHVDYIVVTDDIEKIVTILVNHCQQCMSPTLREK